MPVNNWHPLLNIGPGIVSKFSWMKRVRHRQGIARNSSISGRMLTRG
jgi:hypothetical protein